MRRGPGWLFRGLFTGLFTGLAIVSVSGCGHNGVDATSTPPPTARAVCSQPTGVKPLAVSVDLDGDKRPDALTYYPAKGGCQAYLAATIADSQLAAPLPGIPVGARDLTVLTLPGHLGRIVLVRQQHPRGGFQATLFGYAHGTFEALTSGGKPLFPFIATDVLTTPYSAQCAARGFDIVRATLHHATWTVLRTSYVLRGNDVSTVATSELASGLSDAQLGRRYGAAAHYDLFTGCPTG